MSIPGSDAINPGMAEIWVKTYIILKQFFLLANLPSCKCKVLSFPCRQNLWNWNSNIKFDLILMRERWIKVFPSLMIIEWVLLSVGPLEIIYAGPLMKKSPFCGPWIVHPQNSCIQKSKDGTLELWNVGTLCKVSN